MGSGSRVESQDYSSVGQTVFTISLPGPLWLQGTLAIQI